MCKRLEDVPNVDTNCDERQPGQNSLVVVPEIICNSATNRCRKILIHLVLRFFNAGSLKKKDDQPGKDGDRQPIIQGFQGSGSPSKKSKFIVKGLMLQIRPYHLVIDDTIPIVRVRG